MRRASAGVTPGVAAVGCTGWRLNTGRACASAAAGACRNAACLTPARPPANAACGATVAPLAALAYLLIVTLRVMLVLFTTWVMLVTLRTLTCRRYLSLARYGG